MRTLYVDDTQLVHWQGHVAGIPRVMYELGRRCVSDDQQRVVHVSWVKELAAFAEIDFEATMRRDRGVVYVDPSHNTGGQSDEPVSNPPSELTKAAANAKIFARRAAKKTIRTLRIEDTKLVNKAKSIVVRAEAYNYKIVTFQPQDTLFITWGEWWDANFLKVLENSAAQGVNLVPIIHDVLPFTRAPQFSGHSTDSLREYCQRIVPLSSVVLCVSQSTKNDLKNWLNDHHIAVPSIKVFRLGEDFEFAKAEKPRDPAFTKSGLKGNDYLLTVGTVEARKNHILLYYAHKLAVQRGIDLPKSVIVGRRGWKTEQVYDFMTEDPEVHDKFVFMHNASDEELSWLYDHALFSVFPSMYEGWGMPIAESVARGVPCACSNTTSMVEIAEDYVTHFSPFSTDECLAAIQSLLDKDALRAARQKASEYRQTTWDESYQHVIKCIKEATL